MKRPDLTKSGLRSFLATIGLATLAASVVFSQPANTRPKFVAADVHVDRRVPSVGDLRLRIIPVHSGLYEIDGATLVDLIGIAYGFDADRILGGPTWLEMDRFKLVVHKGTKLAPGYALTAVRKPALKAASDSEPSGCKPASAPGGTPMYGSVNGGPRGLYHWSKLNRHL